MQLTLQPAQWSEQPPTARGVDRCQCPLCNVAFGGALLELLLCVRQGAFRAGELQAQFAGGAGGAGKGFFRNYKQLLTVIQMLCMPCHGIGGPVRR